MLGLSPVKNRQQEIMSDGIFSSAIGTVGMGELMPIYNYYFHFDTLLNLRLVPELVRSIYICFSSYNLYYYYC